MVPPVEVDEAVIEGLDAFRERGELASGRLLESFVERVPHVSRIDVVHEIQHKLPGLWCGEDMRGVRRLLRKGKARDVDLHIQNGRLSEAGTVQGKVGIASFGSIGNTDADTARTESVCTNGCP